MSGARRPESPATTARYSPDAASPDTSRSVGRRTGKGSSSPPAPPPWRTSPPISANTTSSRSCSFANAPTRNGGAWLVTNRTGRLTAAPPRRRPPSRGRQPLGVAVGHEPDPAAARRDLLRPGLAAAADGGHAARHRLDVGDPER